MKKQLFIGALILFTGMMTETFSQKRDKTIKNGFHANLFLGIPSSSYGSTKELGPPSEMRLGITSGLQIGHRWYIKPTKQYGFGILANWADISIAYKSNADFGTSVVTDVTFLAVGPIGTYVIGRDMAVDAYYNIRPTSLGTMFYDPSNKENGTAYFGIGSSHAVGAAFRWKVLNVGLEYVIGSIKTTNMDTHLTTIDEEKIIINNFRIRLGVKL